MFEQKYSRKKYWIISILLLILASMVNIFAEVLNHSDSYQIATFLNILVFIISLFWVNTLANRIRDYGGNPWYALWAFVPIVSLIVAIYYGVNKSIKKINSSIENQSLDLNK